MEEEYHFPGALLSCVGDTLQAAEETTEGRFESYMLKSREKWALLHFK